MESTSRKLPRRNKALIVLANYSFIVQPVYIKELAWYCEGCDETEIETRGVLESTDKTLIFRRLQSIAEDSN